MSCINCLCVDCQKTQGKERSGKWASFRAKFLEGKTCAVCGGVRKLEAHHIKPFHSYPELELQESNLIALCEGTHPSFNCHLVVGHRLSFKNVNETSVRDAAILLKNYFAKENPL